MTRVAVCLVLFASVASANVGRRNFAGDLAGEGVGITGVAIAHEELVIDLRPLAARGYIKVSATYHLDASEDKALDLAFASGSQMQSFVVTLDGKPVPTRSTQAKFPESWQPPKATPLPGGGELDYETEGGVLGFDLALARGRHDLVVTYDAHTGLYHHDAPTLVHQFGYVLAPAKTWAGFGGLDVVVHAPHDWLVAVTPALTRKDDTLRGTFTTVPADAIALSTRAPDGLYEPIRIASRILFAIVGLGGLIGVVWWSRKHARRRVAKHQLPSRLAAFGRGFTWAGAFLATGIFTVLGPDLALAEGQADHYGYGAAFALVGVVLGSLVVLIVGWIVAAKSATVRS